MRDGRDRFIWKGLGVSKSSREVALAISTEGHADLSQARRKGDINRKGF